MHITTPLFSLLGTALLAHAEVVGHWTLWNFSRVCVDTIGDAAAATAEENRCAYRFYISESPDANAGRQTCTFAVYSDASNPRQPSTQIGWANRQCYESGDYLISGGWDERGFITVTVHHPAVDADAWFGYTDEELRDASVVPSKTSPAYKYGTFVEDSSPAVAPPLEAGGNDNSAIVRRRGRGSLLTSRIVRDAVRRHDGEDGEEEGAPCDSDFWVVKNLNRQVNNISQKVILSFDLFRCDSGMHCSLSTLGASTTYVDISHDDFYNVSCEDNKDLAVSWGYKRDTDGAVMTVMDWPAQKRAFLGWDHVNGREDITEEGKGKWESFD